MTANTVAKQLRCAEKARSIRAVLSGTLNIDHLHVLKKKKNLQKHSNSGLRLLQATFFRAPAHRKLVICNTMVICVRNLTLAK